MTTQNKITLVAIVILTLILGLMYRNLNTKIQEFKQFATNDLSSSTLRVTNGTTTSEILLVNVLGYYGQEIFCIKNPTVEGCTPITLPATSTESII